MNEIKIPEARNDKEKDVAEILPMCALPGAVIGGMAGFYLWATTLGVILGAIAGGAVGAAIAYWVLNHSGPVAKEMKHDIRHSDE